MRFEPGGWGAFPSIDADPADPLMLVAGADVGGLQASTDAGASWVICTDSVGRAGVASRAEPNHTISTAFILTVRFLPVLRRNQSRCGLANHFFTITLLKVMGLVPES